jgi:hypothetical protein
MPLLLAKSDPQGQGSAITYARRYALMAVLGLVADEDDDGNKASAAKPKPKRAAPKRNAKAAEAQAEAEGSGPATAATKAELKRAYKAAGATDDEYKNILTELGVKDSKSLTEDHQARRDGDVRWAGRGR